MEIKEIISGFLIIGLGSSLLILGFFHIILIFLFSFFILAVGFSFGLTLVYQGINMLSGKRPKEAHIPVYTGGKSLFLRTETRRKIFGISSLVIGCFLVLVFDLFFNPSLSPFINFNNLSDNWNLVGLGFTFLFGFGLFLLLVGWFVLFDLILNQNRLLF